MGAPPNALFAAGLLAVGGLNRVPCVGEPKTFVTGPAAALAAAACPNAGTDCDADWKAFCKLLLLLALPEFDCSSDDSAGVLLLLLPPFPNKPAPKNPKSRDR